ncbi:DEAD/DEAH box helicase family protein [Mycoplasmoides pneumoniae]|uniref:DEAD/DEAH box helicase family protein n=1 Tax=Mycoplasmoides pneumoniae TaxID=2104 RepID=UPI001CEFA4C3|nr:DEAD/DEAH box helicase family protein [Mycoplasmoides pneumoniae]
MNILAKFLDSFAHLLFLKNKEIYTPRKEQAACVEVLERYFQANPENGRFLMNCKMRFGKCFTLYSYAQKNNINKILILTFVPAVEESLKDDLNHIEKNYKFYTDDDLQKSNFDLKNQNEPYVVFLSLQNVLGKQRIDGAKTDFDKERISKLQEIDFDLIVFDEYHYGANKKRTQIKVEKVNKKIDNPEQQDNQDDAEEELASTFKLKDIKSKFQFSYKQLVCLSGTPFSSLRNNEFSSKDQVFTYSYFDEQKAKSAENHPLKLGQYGIFPEMNIYCFELAEIFTAQEQEIFITPGKGKNKLPEISFRKLFQTENVSKESSKPVYRFVNENLVEKLIDSLIDKRKGFSHTPLSWENIDKHKHSLLILPTRVACFALANLLKNHWYFENNDFQIINMSESQFGNGKKALIELNKHLDEAKKTNKNTLTITVAKLTIGITVKEWSTVFFLKDLKGAESYFQTIFRIQTPYIKNCKNLKEICYVYDFNMYRCLEVTNEYSKQTQTDPKFSASWFQNLDKFLPIYLVRGDEIQKTDPEILQKYEYFIMDKRAFSTRWMDESNIIDIDVLCNVGQDEDAQKILKKILAHKKFKSSKKKREFEDVHLEKSPKSEAFSEGVRSGKDYAAEQGNVLEELENFWNFNQALEQKAKAEFQQKNFDDNEWNNYKKGFNFGVNKHFEDKVSIKKIVQNKIKDFKKRKGRTTSTFKKWKWLYFWWE